MIYLEVAEHLQISSEKGFADSIGKHSKTIVLCATVRGQWRQNHLNEQWAEYWIELFKGKGFYIADIIGALIWQKTAVQIVVKTKHICFLQMNPLLQPINISCILL